jgi:hypothetical protein
MLHIINSLDDSYISLFKDDPVRPEISSKFRCQEGSNSSFVLLDSTSSRVRAVICCAFKSQVPSSIDELLNSSSGSKAVFYTVWSYDRGAGSEIVQSVPSFIRSRFSGVDEFYTFSPKGQSVRNFHLGLGASIYRENLDSVNYSYN